MEPTDVMAVCPGLFDVILMDCEMPVLNGFQATEAIRKLDAKVKHDPNLTPFHIPHSALRSIMSRFATPQVPIIGISGNTLKEDREKAIKAGSTGPSCTMARNLLVAALISVALSSRADTRREAAHMLDSAHFFT
jgi:CheY-like chemotaxis protein